MNKELKLLVISIVLVLVGFFAIYFSGNNSCWSKYETENEAILNCEGK